MLVTEAEYRSFTNDSTSAASAVSARLEESQEMVQDYLERILESGEYTEVLEVWYTDGLTYVYPLATPITEIPSGASYDIDVGDRRLVNVTSDVTSVPFLGYAFPDPNVDSLSPHVYNRPDYASVTYTGGFTNATCPILLKMAIARVARRLMVLAPDAQIGADEVSVGDVSVKWPKNASAIDALVPGISQVLRSYKRKRVRF